MKFFFARIINHVVANIQQKFHVLGMICSSCKHETVLSQDDFFFTWPKKCKKQEKLSLVLTA